jgi:glutamyl-Q tRNA(Asp) synthetase
MWSYQLAVVVDDAEQGVTHVVRGADLTGNTARQLWLQNRLGYTSPSYRHVPLILDELGEKLSKQHGAAPIDACNPVQALNGAARALGLNEQQAASASVQCALADWVEQWKSRNAEKRATFGKT